MCAYLVAPWKSVGGATALQNAGALTDDERTARSVLECASPLALWEGVKQFSAERELSQLAAGGMTRDGWDDFDAAVSGDALRIGTIRAPEASRRGPQVCPDVAGHRKGVDRNQSFSGSIMAR